MPVGILSNTNAAAECAPIGSGSPDTSQVGGDYQNGSFSIPVTGPYGSGLNVALVQQLPALTRVQLPPASNPNVTKLGPQEYGVTLSLSGTDTVQLNPAYANSQNVPTAPVAPAAPAFTYTSRNSYVATVSPTGLVTGHNIGECTVLVGTYRGVNMVFPSATPPAGNTGNEIYCEVSLKVRE